MDMTMTGVGRLIKDLQDEVADLQRSEDIHRLLIKAAHLRIDALNPELEVIEEPTLCPECMVNRVSEDE